MPTFRILDQTPVYFDDAGNPLSGGYLQFYASGTTTAKDVYAGPAKATNLGSTVALDASGRTSADVWGEGSYRVRVYAADNTLIAEADPVELTGGGGSAIPALQAGEFLTNDGAVMSWSPVRQVPDPTGSSGKVLSNDGANLTWIDKPADGATPTIPVDITSSSFKMGGDGLTKFMIQTGSGTTTNNNPRSAGANVAFSPNFYADPMFVGVTPRYTGTVSPWGNAPIPHITSKSTTGFGVWFHAGELDDTAAEFDFNTAIDFDWVAIGLVDA